MTRSLVESNGETIIENKKLVGLRDRLLPMLMNGQATVEAMQPNYRLSYRGTWTCAWAPAEVRKNIGHGIGGGAVTRISTANSHQRLGKIGHGGLDGSRIETLALLDLALKPSYCLFPAHQRRVRSVPFVEMSISIYALHRSLGQLETVAK